MCRFKIQIYYLFVLFIYCFYSVYFGEVVYCSNGDEVDISNIAIADSDNTGDSGIAEDWSNASKEKLTEKLNELTEDKTNFSRIKDKLVQQHKDLVHLGPNEEVRAREVENQLKDEMFKTINFLDEQESLIDLSIARIERLINLRNND